MRFMLFMYPGSYTAGDTTPPDAEAIGRMGRFNEELTKAGVLLALDGLHPPTEGARVAYAGGRPTIVDGPFPEAKEVVGGYWVIDVRSKEEAVAWATKIPAEPTDFVEIRRVFELSDLPADVQDAARLSAEPPAQTTAR